MNKQTNIVIKLFAVKTNKPNNNQMTDQTEDSTINRPTDRTNKLQTDRKNERTDRPYGQTTDRPTDHTNDGAERMNNGRTVRTNEGKNRDTNEAILLTRICEDFFCCSDIDEHFLSFFLVVSFVLIRMPLHGQFTIRFQDFFLRCRSETTQNRKRFTECVNCFYY